MQDCHSPQAPQPSDSTTQGQDATPLFHGVHGQDLFSLAGLEEELQCRYTLLEGTESLIVRMEDIVFPSHGARAFQASQEQGLLSCPCKSYAHLLASCRESTQSRCRRFDGDNQT